LGRVVDTRHQPIEDVLVSEEQYFYNTRTDSKGEYRIFVDLLEYKYPVLHFLRGGFRGKSIDLKSRIAQHVSMLEIDVELEDDKNSISAEGWVGRFQDSCRQKLKITPPRFPFFLDSNELRLSDPSF
jgi:hypothetical protein